MLIAHITNHDYGGSLGDPVIWKLEDYGDGYQAGYADHAGTGNGQSYVIGAEPEERHVIVGPWQCDFDICVLPVAIAAGYATVELAEVTRLLQC